MVINIGALKSRLCLVEQDIRGIVQSWKAHGGEVILRDSMLTRERRSWLHAGQGAGADFVKTSTGFGGASDGRGHRADARGRRPRDGVKASGGVRTKEDVEAMVAAGGDADRASAGVKIVRGEAAGGKGY